MGPGSDAKQRDPPRDAVRREGERTSSPRPQSAKQNRTAGELTPDRFMEAALTIMKNNKSSQLLETCRCSVGEQEVQFANIGDILIHPHG